MVRQVLKDAQTCLDEMEKRLFDVLEEKTQKPEYLFLRTENTSKGQSFSIHSKEAAARGGAARGRGKGEYFPVIKLKVDRYSEEVSGDETSETELNEEDEADQTQFDYEEEDEIEEDDDKFGGRLWTNSTIRQ